MRFRKQGARFLLLQIAAILAFVISYSHLKAQDESSVDYGLAFVSHEATKDQRTSLDLNPEGPFEIKKDFELAFDISYLRLTNAFGYIFRVIANDSLNIDLVSSPEHSEFKDLNLVVNNSPVQVHYDFDEIKLNAGQWNHVIVSVSATSGQISMSWNGMVKSVPFPLKRLRTARFFFGANDFGKFNTSDVPPMAVKNIEISVDKRQWLKWELKRHDRNRVYDVHARQVAIAKNPAWLIDHHVKWKHRQTLTTGKYPSAAFDNTNGVLYITDADSISVIDLKTGEIRKSKPTGGSVVHTDANQLLFVEETGDLYNYNVTTNVMSRYDFEKSRWDNQDTTYVEPGYWHNNKFYNFADSSIYSFGGYGFYSYQNTFFRFDKLAQQWVPVKTQGSIPPRYLGALGIDRKKNRVLIFGGYGSKSGKQEMSPRSFYDLYSFDLRNHQIRKIWEEQTSETSPNIVFSNSLILNEKDSCFYVLAYPKDKYKSYLRLRSYSLSKPERTELGDSIPFLFHDIHSFCDLFHAKATQELIAVTAHKEDSRYRVQVFSIKYPPLPMADSLQQIPDQNLAINKIYIVAAIMGVLLVFVGIRYKQNRKRSRQQPSTAPPDMPQPLTQQDPVKGSFIIEADQKSSSIELFGGFQVMDKSGADITHKFTATLKELFIFILIHSVKFEKGVSTTVLHEVFWPDKDEVSARNNRNVNLKKLRNLLQEIGNIAIENTNSYVRLILDDAVFCDYQTARRILNGGKIDRQIVEVLLKYVRRGSLLPNIQASWLDSFKSEISNSIIDTLLEYSGELDIDSDDKLLLDIADSIFNYDPINQEAMVLKCSVLNKKGKHSLAKNCYDHFAKEYLKLYGEHYPRTFEDVVSMTDHVSPHTKFE